MPRRSPGRPLDISGAAALIMAATLTLSFSSLYELALMSGFGDRLSYAWPVCLDAVGYLGTRLWLLFGPAWRFARGLALAAIALSVIANGLVHGLTSTGTTRDTLIAIAVGAVPPVMLALVIHALVASRTGTAVPAAEEAPAVRADQTVPAEAADRVPVGLPAPVQSPVPAAVPVPEPVAAPVQHPDRTGLDQVKPVVPVQSTSSRTAGDEELLDKLRALAGELGKRPSVAKVRNALGVGTGRATKLLARYDTEPADRTGPVQTGLHLVPADRTGTAGE